MFYIVKDLALYSITGDEIDRRTLNIIIYVQGEISDHVERILQDVLYRYADYKYYMTEHGSVMLKEEGDGGYATIETAFIEGETDRVEISLIKSKDLLSFT